MAAFEQLFKTLNITEPELREALLQTAVEQTLPVNSFVVEQDKYIKWLPIVVSGKVRVWQEQDDRQILLYYVAPFQTCALSLSAIFKDCKSLIYAKTVEETTIIKIPVQHAGQWTFRYASWNRFTTASFISSYEDLLLSYKNLAFSTVDKRLSAYLRSMAVQNGSRTICLSHSQLARELGTTREVISKILKQFETAGMVQLRFKAIELLPEFS
ncbi:MAG: Crp/Fnr family transcriptional regulator [Chitinophagaceae bacterium]